MAEKLDMKSMDITQENISKIQALFPSAVTEVMCEDGKVKLAIDFDVLKQELSADLISEKQERYQMIWPDKSKAKVLANSRITATLRPDKEKSVDFDNTQNLYIEGDNLDVLKLLQETYLHKIDVIYIDPPYNTGRNLIYKNDFSSNYEDYLSISGQFDEDGKCLVPNLESNGRFHTDWLNMIYSRLKVARQLLKETGIIVLTIDDCEIETITMVMNEIFGEKNHLATIIIKNNPSGRSTVSGASISHEYALFYSATNTTTMGRLPRNEKQIARYKEKDDEGFFEWVNFRKHGGYKEDAPTMYYPIYIKKDGSSFRIPKLKWDEKSKEYEVIDTLDSDEFVSYPIDEEGRARRWKWSLERARSDTKDMGIRVDRDKQFAVYIKSRMKEEGMLPLTVWDETKYSSTEYGTNYLIDIMGERYFDYPKSIYAVIDCLKVANCHPEALVLDFFGGSGTTSDAVMQLNAEDGGNRKFIMVQLPEKCDTKSEAYKAGYKTICDIGEERIRRAGKKIKEESGMLVQNLDTGFRVLKLDSSNMQEVYYNPSAMTQSLLDETVDNVKPDRTPLDLLFQVMLDLGIELSAKIDEHTVNGKTYYAVNDNDIIACFDDNIDNDVITAIAKQSPLYAVFKDKSFATDSVGINNEQLFKTYSPSTVVKVI